MSRHRVEVYLHHMLDHAREAMEFARGRTRGDLDTDRLFALAVVRLLEVIGEAASRGPQEDRATYVDIDWPRIVGMRNRLIHGYEKVSYDTVWLVLENDLPPLVAALERALGEEGYPPPE